MRRGSSLLLGWPLALLAMAAFTWLGTWQLGRMHEKQAMLDAAHEVLVKRDPRPLSLAAEPARLRDYDWAGGEGIFADGAAVLLDNQQHAGRTGVRAYRVFLPSASGSAPLLVELGWLPLQGDRRMPHVARPQGELRVEGLLAPPPAHGIASAPAVPQSDGALLAMSLDTSNLQQTLAQPRLAPRVLRLDPANPLGYARDLDVLPNTLPPERHLGYAVQWFGLALAVLATALVLTFRKTPPSRTPAAQK